MAITNISRTWAVSPGIVNIISTDDLTDITTAGYLDSEEENINTINGGTFQWDPSDLILIYYAVNQWSFFARNPSTGTLTVVIGGDASGVTPQEIQNEQFTYSVATGPADAYVAHLDPAITTLVPGLVLQLKINVSNTSTTPTVNIDGNILTVVDVNSTSIVPNDMVAGGISWLVYDGTNLQLLNPAVSTASPVTPSDIQQQTFVYTTDVGNTGDDYTASYTPTLSSLNTGTRVSFLCLATNTTTTPTFDPDGLGSNDIVNNADGPINIGDMVQNMNVELSYNDNGHWQLINPASAGSVTPADIQNQAYSYSADDGDEDIYHADYTPPITAYVEGMRLTFEADNGNTGPSTFAANALGANAIVLPDGSPLSAGDIPPDSIVDVILKSNGDWQLMSASPAGGSGVSPSEIQNQLFVFAVDTGAADALEVAFTPPFAAYVDGMSMEVQVLANNTGSPTIDVDGLGPVDIYDIGGNALAADDLVAGGVAKITRASGYMQLLNPASATADAVTPQQIQNQAFTSSADSGVADAYIGSYSPTLSLDATTTVELIIANANLTTTPTLDVSEGSGPLPIVSCAGTPLNVDDLAPGMIAIFAFDVDNTRWQLINPLSSIGSTDQVVGVFTPTLLNYTLNGGTGLVATGTYVSTGANLFINAYFTNPGGTISTSAENGNFSGFPLSPVEPAKALLTEGAAEFRAGSPYDATIPNTMDAEGLVTIVEGDTRYLVVGGNNNDEVYVYEFGLTTSTPGFELTAVGGSQATAFNMAWMDTFVFSGTTYIIGADEASNNFTTVSFSAGVISAVTSTGTTASNPNIIQQFFYSGTQYCVVFKLNGNIETFTFDGSTWTSIDDLNIANPSDSQPMYIAPIGGIPYLVNSDNTTELAKTWSFNGTTWVTAATDVAFTSAASQDSFALFDFAGDTFFVLGSGDSIELYVWSSDWVFQQTIATNNIWSVTPFVKDGVAYVQVFTDTNTLYFYSLFYDATSSLVEYLNFVNGTASTYFGQTLVFNNGPVTYSFGASRDDNNVGGHLIVPTYGDDFCLIQTDGVGYVDQNISDVTSILMNVTYETVGLTSITFPNSVVQNFSTFFAPFAFSSGTDQVYVFDATVGPAGPVTYSAGNFTIPGGAPKTWEIVGQFYALTNTMDNMRLYVSSPFTSNFLYTSPVMPGSGGSWMYINWRGEIASGANVQVLFDSSGSGTIDNGSGVFQGITSFMTIRQI